MREIAQAAGVTHGTIRAINNRLAIQAAESDIPSPDKHHELGPWGEPINE